MTARAVNLPRRRGACPGLSAPMQTGDGLLVRLMPIGSIAISAFLGLCAAAQRHGNGVIEVTSRGSIQVRGLSASSAPQFAADIGTLGIAAQEGIPILINPLSGIAAAEILNSRTLVDDLRRELARGSLPVELAPKLSVVIDGGGPLNLDDVTADVRLRASNEDLLRVSVGGDDAGAIELGMIAVANSVEAVMRLLTVVAKRGGTARARDILAAEGVAPFRTAIADFLTNDVRAPAGRRSAEPIGTYRLLDGSFAYGVGLAFGHADAALLEQLSEAARAAGAHGWRAAGRALMAIGLMQDASPEFAAAAERLGFIVRADDPRRHVVACAGAPICASAEIAARAIAPRIAEIAAPFIDRSFTIHVSGCAKGCAHAAPAALTVVGTPDGCALVANGFTRDAPIAVVSTNDLPAAIAKLARERTREGGHV